MIKTILAVRHNQSKSWMKLGSQWRIDSTPIN